jgi:hypothetical protein
MTCSPNKFFGRREGEGEKKKEGLTPLLASYSPGELGEYKLLNIGSVNSVH